MMERGIVIPLLLPLLLEWHRFNGIRRESLFLELSGFNVKESEKVRKRERGRERRRVGERVGE